MKKLADKNLKNCNEFGFIIFFFRYTKNLWIKASDPDIQKFKSYEEKIPTNRFFLLI